MSKSSKKPYVAKRLPYFEVLGVTRTVKGTTTQVAMQFVKHPDWMAHNPDSYSLNSGKILLPRRKRGVKFKVLYTEIKEMML